jgi:hypothetical protein
VGAYEGVLRDFLRIRVVVQQSHRRRENPGLVAAHYLSEGGFVAAVESPHEDGVLDSFGVHNA